MRQHLKYIIYICYIVVTKESNITSLRRAPRTNGQVERMNFSPSKRSIDALRQWYKFVSNVQQGINSTFARSTKTTPFELLTVTKMRLKSDEMIENMLEDNLESKQRRMFSRFETITKSDTIYYEDQPQTKSAT